MSEQWKRISTHPDYDISDKGRIRKKAKREFRYIATSTNAHGYSKCNIQNGNPSERTQLLHRLVAKAFIPNPEDKPVVHHINADKTDNRAENLEWCTHQENSQAAAETRWAGHVAQKTFNNREIMREIQDIKGLLKEVLYGSH